jgi:hypothetical protein
MNFQRIILSFTLIFSISAGIFVNAVNGDEQKLRGEYLEMSKPNSLPVIFAPEIASRSFNERDISFMPDGKFLFFTSKRSPYKAYSETPISYEDYMKILKKSGNGNTDIYWVDSKMIEDLRDNFLGRGSRN